METPELAVIMPVYNEEGAIAKVIGEWTQTLSALSIDFRIHAYNDGSKDNTLAKLQALSAENGRLVVHDKPNSGHGPTILKGYIENAGCTWLFQADSDDEISPAYFTELWTRRDQYDFLAGRRVTRNSPPVRQLISLVSRLLVRTLYGKGVHDVNVPFRLMRTECYKDLVSRIPEDTFAPNVLISGLTGLKKYRVFETPVESRMRQTGVVSIRKWKLLKAAARSFRQTITFRFTL